MKRLVLSVLLLGCGNKLHHGIDAPPPDVAIDAFGPNTGEPPPNAVKLTVMRNGVPVIGIGAIFQNADGSLVATASTNELGLAWAELASGGYVTALDHIGNNLDELTTFAAVQPADNLLLELGTATDPTESPIVLGIPADPNTSPAAAEYQIYTTCGGPFGADPAVPSEILLVGCSGVADIVVESRDDVSSPLRAFYVPNISIPTGPPTTIYVAASYNALANVGFGYTNVPDPITFLGTYQAIASERGRVYERTTGASVSTGEAKSALLVPDVTAPALTITTTFGADVGQQLIYDGRSTGNTNYALDVGGVLLPRYSAAPAFDAATRTVSWSEASGGTAADLVRTRVHIYRDDIPTGRAWGWRIVAPRSSTSVAYPQLPVFGFDFNPKSGDIAGISELTNARVPGGFAAARRIGFSDLTSLVIGTTDRMVVQGLMMMEL